ncbi:helix-turn-helix domain-containing protein [Fusobacterium nucleatum]|uniref:helix-turn-helix domain-containing protein n=1 Tax=Fusobacterium nucleatum TaxID=851 RepID=UPI0030D4F1BC
MERPGYYGILPANIRYDKNLKPMEKIMYSELTALSNKNGYCNATNSYFAELYEVSKNTVSLWIGDLEKAGYIKTKLIYETGTKIIKERRIYISDPITKNDDTYHEKEVDPITKNDDTPITKNREDNNTSIINTRLILKEKYKKEKPELIYFITSQGISKEYEEKLLEFLEYRRKIKKPIKTIRAINCILNEFRNTGEKHAISCIDFAMDREYIGVKADYIKISKAQKAEVEVKWGD